MSGIESTRISTSITTYEKVKIQTVQQETEKRVEDFSGYNNDGYAKVDPNNKEGSASSNINILPEEKPIETKHDSSISAVKKLSTGVLIGGSAGYLASAVGTGFMTSNFKGSPMGLGLGVAIGTGSALLNTETNNEKLNVAKNVTGSALLVGGATGVATSIAKSIFSANGLPTSASPTTIALSAGLGAGIALNNANVGEGKTANLVKNTTSGVLVGAGVTGLATGVAKSLLASDGIARLASPTTIALGAAVGAGVKLANSEVDNNGLRVAKNAVAGTLIGGGTAGLVTSAGKTLLMSTSIPFEHGKGFLAKSLLSESHLFSSPSRTAILVAATIGAGIAIANTKE